MPDSDIVDPGQIAANRIPESFADGGTIFDIFIRQAMKINGIETAKFSFVKLRLRTSQAPEIQRSGQFRQRIKRRYAFRGADFGQKRANGQRFDAFFPQLANTQRPQTFGEFSLFAGQQRQMRELGNFAAESLKHLYLNSRIADMVFAADNVGYAEVDVINDRWQMIQKAAVFAYNNRVA